MGKYGGGARQPGRRVIPVSTEIQWALPDGWTGDYPTEFVRWRTVESMGYLKCENPHQARERERERRLSRRYIHDRRFDVINHTRLVWATHFGVYHQCVSLVTIVVVVACRLFSFPPTTRIKGVPTILCIFVLSFFFKRIPRQEPRNYIRPPVFYVLQHRHT